MVGKTETIVTPKSVKVFDCTQCGAPVKVRAEGMSLVCICGSCHTIMDALDERHEIIAKSASKNFRIQYIELGTRGKFKGHFWEVIGYMEKSDNVSYRWSEYLLFNPVRGFRWITENEGHWNYIVPIKKIDLEQRISAEYGGNSYDLFHKGASVVINVLGEFYWRVSIGDHAIVKDYVKNDEILSYEKMGTEVSWSLGEYVDPETIRTVFKLKGLPSPNGVAPNQPNIMASHSFAVTKLWSFFIVLAIAIHLIAMVISQNRVVSSNDFYYPVPASVGEKVDRATPIFSLNDETANLQIVLDANINDSWLYVVGNLVNVDTGETVEFDKGIEYYSGRDSDGKWSEGSRRGDIILLDIPIGNYQLNFEVSGDKSADYKITVRRDVLIRGNILWVFGLLSFVPLLLLFRKRNFEMKRWSQSDFSPFPSHHD